MMLLSSLSSFHCLRFLLSLLLRVSSYVVSRHRDLFRSQPEIFTRPFCLNAIRLCSCQKTTSKGAFGSSGRTDPRPAVYLQQHTRLCSLLSLRADLGAAEKFWRVQEGVADIEAKWRNLKGAEMGCFFPDALRTWSECWLIEIRRLRCLCDEATRGQWVSKIKGSKKGGGI